MSTIERLLNTSGGNWVLHEHVTQPRPSCIGLPRKYAPVDVTTPAFEMPRSKPGYQASEHYENVFCNRYGRWRCQFSYLGKRQNVPGTYASDHDAARAYNAHIEAQGIDRPTLKIVEATE